MRIKNILIKVFVILIIIVLVGWFLHKFDISSSFNFKAAERYIRSYGQLAGLVYIAVFVIRTLLVFFPYSIMVILGGSIFGPVHGYLYCMISVFLSTTLAFYIPRLFGREAVQRLLKKKAKNLDLKIEQHSFKIILVMRLSVVFPFDIINYAAGMTNVKYRDVVLATMLGVIPETLSMTYLGHNLNHIHSRKFIISIVMVIITVAIPLVYNKLKKKKENN